ncbi:TPA: translation initiation factor IF-2 [Streptococcus pneumoniae]|uniref:Translation initiation factor IF-2 n=1 Tax=Streptococcus pneumoniae serotype 19F (strain G54) TaxID=512566 RepID=IF2_STRP4|nr:translation initiation factor IF-2 [Streptococcus pneumoniae]B5E266.1 RecName: Full=Translation initiation factor IF-2 [Streptococcus pneumoniae G54]EHD73833.1 translation initiation factor IF-2 [Streptococcus pneumoniae GA44194]ACF56844.1 translation initiation factor IF-2 [Streptococcus pneumoniae G54]EHZ60605.1 translation initiation factor IF-2 [Streptococcus pneumoniae GA47179]EHZ73686.1 translation initiation factor IF-2 [Streptococcus pneumoniae GA47794]EJG86289.1 translation initia
MSKKRLYEIAKELGKESKEVVARAKELGLDVKSHSSSVEEAVAAKIAASFKPAAAPKVEAKPAAPKVSAEKKAEKSEPAKPAVAKEEAKPAEPVAPKTEKVAAKPQSRNFKAEREARAKEQAERRKQNKGNNRDQQQNGNRQKNDGRNGGKQGQSNRDNRRFNDQAKKEQGQQKRRNERRQQEDKRSNQVAPRIDFKARAAALKAEQNAEYARSSEERFKQYQAAKEALAQANKRKEPEEIFEEAAKLAEQAQQVQAVVEVVPEKKEPAVDTRRKKQARPDKNRDDYDHEEDGPRKQQKNRSSQNQVRNQKNSNWNNNKKNKKGNNKNNRNQTPKPVTERKFHELPTEFEYTDGMTVAEIAKRIKREPAEIVKKLFMMGVMATQNQSLDGETIELLMVDYGIEAKQKVEVDNADIERFFVEDGYLNEDELVERPPVVTIMGHVDHGKTTLLDTLRNSRVATGEAGGITQHIGAYQIVENGKKITFLDTPGHAAFTSMRARGASVTDITILVVAADDGVMPQTIEAINHSKAANVPIIVAINKIDKPGANPERVIGELAEHGVMSTAWGGDSEFVEISAKFNQNIEELLETVLLVAEIQELKADPTVRAIGTVIEARLDKGKGAVATLLVQQGTLNVQDPIVVGNTFGRVRAMTNDLGRRVKVAGPSTPVSITGLNEAPMAGDHFAVYEDEKSARAAGEERAKRALMKQRQATQRVSLENLFDTLKAGELKSVNVIIKADVQGSVEALSASLQKIDVEGVKVTIVHSAVGAINESDVTLAEASNAFIVGFNVRPTPQARQQAEADDVEIRLHSIIYKVIEEMEEAMKGMLDPEFEEKVIGEAVIRETFKVSKVGTIGGFMVINGKVARDSKVRVIRDGVVIYDGELASLKHYKDDVKEVTNGREGGLMIDGYNDIKMDDVIEAYVMEEIKR